MNNRRNRNYRNVSRFFNDENVRNPNSQHEYNPDRPERIQNSRGRYNSRVYSRGRGGYRGRNGWNQNMSWRREDAGNGRRCVETEEVANSQREELAQRLRRGEYECMICVEVVRVDSAIWSCRDGCYNMFHMHCIRKWVHSCEGDQWRCPACQKEYDAEQRIRYDCFCGKMAEPARRQLRNVPPHCCGEVCGLPARDGDCPHLCSLCCHPGPCPPCEASVSGPCYCGATQMTVKCGLSATSMTCSAVCDKKLGCGRHRCSEPCHPGPCGTCQETVMQPCHCGRSDPLTLPCEDRSPTVRACELPCGLELSCGNHQCSKSCHPVGECPVCPTDPGSNPGLCCPCNRCPVDQTTRLSCLDPVPPCGGPCGRQRPHCAHPCPQTCHHGPCPPCNLSSDVRCRCGKTSRNLACAELDCLLSSNLGVRCTNKCRARKLCGLHRCQEDCCDADVHVCELVCGRPLSCGLHQCERDCHGGNHSCGPCLRNSYEEASCACGRTVQLPPIACGSPGPDCMWPCELPLDCGHPTAQHKCHPATEKCPPCTRLTSKPCPGGHTILHNLPCHIQPQTCGRPCSHPLPSCHHACNRLCHPGPCLSQTQPSCSQACSLPLPSCGHPCSQTCAHPGPCSASPPLPRGCLVPISLHCRCVHGLTIAPVPCHRLQAALALMLASPDSASDILPPAPPLYPQPGLQCGVDCRRAARTAQIHDAFSSLAISSTPIAPEETVFSTPFLKHFSTSNPDFLLQVDRAFCDLVRRLDTDKQRKVIHRFVPMNTEKRRFIHELSDSFCLTSYSNDPEPKRHVVVEAVRGVCKIPQARLLLSIQKNFPDIFKPDKALPARHVKVPMSKIAASGSYADKMKSIRDLTSSDTR